MGVDLQFNPQQYQPSYDSSAGRLPSGKYQVIISEITAERTKNGDGGLLKFEFTVAPGTPNAGRKVYTRLNLWNPSEQAKQIAHQQMSAICYCLGIYQQINNTDLLKNRPMMIEVVDDGQYSNVTSFMDASGNKPGQQGGAAPAQQPMAPQQGQQFAPQQQQAPQQSMPQFGAPSGPSNAQPFQQQAAPFNPPQQGGNPFPQQGQPPQQQQAAPGGFPAQVAPGQAAPWQGQPQQGAPGANPFGQQAYSPQGAPAQQPQFAPQGQQQQAPAGWPQ